LGVPSLENAKLAARLDAAALAPEFARTGKLHIPDFLDAGFAKSLHAAMAGDVPWMRTMVIGGRGVEAPLAAFLAAGPQRAQIEAQVAEIAQRGFQYNYDGYRLSSQIDAGKRLNGALAPIETFYDFLNSESFLSFVRALTGDAAPAYCDAHVTRYGAGHFLRGHDDGNAQTGRLYAYVMNLTPEWQTDWGGILMFQDEKRDVTLGLPPRFNALNIFRVPQWHSVSQVASFVKAHRYAITGWVRTARVAPKI
jgi:SM-20-related protein